MASLRGVGKTRTICEVLREINDISQSASTKDALIRKKITEASSMAKRMSAKLLEYNKAWDADWWAKNPEAEQKIKIELRKSSSYKT